MDAFLVIASKRDHTHPYADRPIPDEAARRILDAGRLTGSAQNRQPWSFLIVEDSERRTQLAEAVYEPDNVREAQLIVAISGPRPFDLGRCTQNMMLAAWNDGVASSPNGIADTERAKQALSLDEPPVTVLTFGYPAKARQPERRSAEEWSARANRKPLDELVRRI
jgi:nitroreductase